ncbi:MULTISPECIES: hypothetical protein [unclassified Butyrivibrio]|uniref:hypothetical protein n=1 Tax=unclassified Butyrivibrio TaxID=2639466 RepID=UPI00047A4345|nr:MULTISPECIES: hypothetical protein [unclassified Butyrivibrio]
MISDESVIITEENIKDIKIISEGDSYRLVLFLDSEGTKRIYEATKELSETGGKIGICEGPYLYADLNIFFVINSDQINVLTFETLEEAEEQKMYILSGKLPYELDEIESYSYKR